MSQAALLDAFAPGARLVTDEGVSPSDAATLERTARLLRHDHPEVRGIMAYTIGRGEMVVRVMTASGWVPAIIRVDDLEDPAGVAARLERALSA